MGISAKQLLSLIQNYSDKHLCYSDVTNEVIVEEDGKVVEYRDLTEVNWKFALSNSLILGKCGELYAQHLLETMGYTVYQPIVDDHGIDLIAKKNGKDILYVQVKTVKAGNYTFIKEKNFPDENDEKNFVVFYIRVGEDGVPRTYVFTRKQWPEKNEKKIEHPDDKRFSYNPYANGQKSEPEYGISGAKKYYSENDKFCIDSNGSWECNEDEFNRIVFSEK